MLLQRLPQLIEQAGIFDGDDGLAGKIGEQRNLCVCKWTNFLTIDDDHSNQFIVLEHRHSDKGPDPAEFDGFDDRRMAFGIRLCRCQVGDVDSPLSFNCLAKTGPGRGVKWTASARLGKRRRQIVRRGDAKSAVFVEKEIAKLASQSRTALAVKPQEVILGQTKSADRWLACEANMRPVPVVTMEPSGQRGISLL